MFVTNFAVLFRSVEYFTALPYNYPVVISIRLWIIPLTAGNSIGVTELWRTTWSKSIRFQIKFGFQETEVFIALRTGNVRYKQNIMLAVARNCKLQLLRTRKFQRSQNKQGVQFEETMPVNATYGRYCACLLWMMCILKSCNYS